MNEKRGHWYLLTGLILGLVIGLAFAWYISPVKYTDIEPGALAPADKDAYRRAIALAYSANQDLERARVRLALLDAEDPAPALAAQAQQMLANHQPPQEARALALLAADLGRPATAPQPQTTAVTPAPVVAGEQIPPAHEGTDMPTLEAGAAIQTPTQAQPTRTPTATLTPAPTFTPRPTATPMPVLDAPFTLKSRDEICNGALQPGLLQIEVSDGQGTPLPGVPIVITWQDGEDTFYTGLAPEISPGYADFVMADNTIYQLHVGEASDEIKGIKKAEGCSIKLGFSEAGANNS